MSRAKNLKLPTLNARLALVLNQQVGQNRHSMMGRGPLPVRIQKNKWALKMATTTSHGHPMHRSSGHQI